MKSDRVSIYVTGVLVQVVVGIVLMVGGLFNTTMLVLAILYSAAIVPVAIIWWVWNAAEALSTDKQQQQQHGGK